MVNFLVTFATAGGGLCIGFLMGLTPLMRYFPSAIGYLNLATLLVCIVNIRKGWCDCLQSMREGVFLQFSIFISAIILGTGLMGASWDDSPLWWARQGGFLPATDAEHYFTQAVRWPEEYFDPVNSRRPLNTCINIALVNAAGSTLLGSLAIKSALAAIGIGLFIYGLAQHVRRLVAVASGIAFLYWVWPFSSVFLTEINSVIYASAGFGLVLLGASRKSLTLLIGGLVFVAIATNLRPLNPLLPGILTLVLLLQIRCKQSKPIACATIASAGIMLIGWGAPKVAHALYGAPGSVLLGNVGHTLLGLSRGSDWYEAEQCYKSRYEAKSEGDANGLMMEMAWQELSRNPAAGLYKSLSNLKYFISDIYSEMTKAVGLGYPAQRVCQTRLGPQLWRLIFLAGLVAGCVVSYRKQETIVTVFGVALLSALGVAPLVYSDAGWRSLAASYPALALFIPILLSVAIRDYQTVDQARPAVGAASNGERVHEPALAPAVALMGVFMLSLVWPLTAKSIRPVQQSDAESVFEVVLREGALPRWVAPNTAIASPEIFIKEVETHEKILCQPLRITEFLKQNRAHIKALRLVLSSRRSAWELIADSAVVGEGVLSDPALHPLLPDFIVSRPQTSGE